MTANELGVLLAQVYGAVDALLSLEILRFEGIVVNGWSIVYFGVMLSIMEYMVRMMFGGKKDGDS